MKLAVTTAVVVALYGAFIGAVLWRNGGDVSFLVRAGEKFCDRAQTPPGLTVKRGGGYDGQFVYRLALEPWTREPTKFGITLDNPPYRQQRVLYPLLAWGGSMGQARIVPLSLLVVNLLAVAGICVAGGMLAREFGRDVVWGAGFALYPGFFVTAMLDLNEILAAALVVWALVAMRRERFAVTAVLLALAVLARETTLLFAIAWLVVGRWRWSKLIPIATYIGWQLLLRANWGVFPALAGARNIGLPLVGFASFVRAIVRFDNPFALRWLIELLLAITFILLVSMKIRRNGFLILAWLLYLAMALCLTRDVWSNDWAFLRALSELWIVGVAMLLQTVRTPIKFDAMRGAAITAIFALVVLAGCNQPASPTPRSAADVTLFGPVSMRIHPIFTDIKDWNDDGRPDGIEALLEFQDQFGDPTKASGTAVFELNGYRAYNPDPRGDRIVNPWVGSLNTLAEQQARWNRTSRTYTFQLACPPIDEHRSYVLSATFDTGKTRFFDRIILEAKPKEKHVVVPAPAATRPATTLSATRP